MRSFFIFIEAIQTGLDAQYVSPSHAFRCLARPRLAGPNHCWLRKAAIMVEPRKMWLKSSHCYWVNAKVQEGFSCCRCRIDLGWREDLCHGDSGPCFETPPEGALLGPGSITPDEVWSMRANFTLHHPKVVVACSYCGNHEHASTTSSHVPCSEGWSKTSTIHFLPSSSPPAPALASPAIVSNCLKNRH